MTPVQLNQVAYELGVRWLPWQQEAFDWAMAHDQGASARACYYYKTGAGKSITTLVSMRIWGYDKALVVTPPSTFRQWRQLAEKLGMDIETMSHAKFRMPGTQFDREVPVIADEFHLFGGHGKKGYTRLERLSQGMKAPLLLASATPNYNDAERVYCIQRLLDPASTRGGYLQWIYNHCLTEVNPFSPTPEVTGFKNFADAAEMLASLENVHYVPDDLQYVIDEVTVPVVLPDELLGYGFNRSRHRMMASIIERKHAKIYQSLVGPDELIRPEVYDMLEQISGNSATPILVFANHSSVADALSRTLRKYKVRHLVVTGKVSTKEKESRIQMFLDGGADVLVGTASLATGTDGLDKMCDTLVILDDTDDDALRRQLIGRIMPRGTGGDASKKSVIRIGTT